jgi:chromate transporter
VAGAGASGSAREVFGAFLRLGVSSFGGPIAHLGYMRAEFVERRRWLDDERFAQLVAIAQFLPGPASTQLGFAIGLLRAGWAGAVSAFLAFTLPSALLLVALAGAGGLLLTGTGTHVTHGLKLVAVAVVAHGVTRMARQMAPDGPRALIAAAACGLILLVGTASAQLLVLVLGALAGVLWCRGAVDGAAPALSLPYGGRVAFAAAALFIVGLAAAVAWDNPTPTPAGVAAAFYRAGALVFGGGHVVLPLLEASVVGPGWMGPDTFLTGYGAAQAVPGPMFSLAAFLGAEIPLGLPPVVGAGIALLAIFLPGCLVLVAVLPAWARLRAAPRAGSIIAGVNASVVGLLGAALYDPVWTSAVRGAPDVAIAAVAFALLATFERATLWVVAWCVAAALLAG